MATAQGGSGTKKTDYEVELDPTWSVSRLQQKVKEDIMSSGLAVKDHNMIDQLRLYYLENNMFTPVNPQMQIGEQKFIKPGGHLLFTRVPKETLNYDRYTDKGRRNDSQTGGF